MKRLVILWVISTLALLLLPVVFSGVTIDDWKYAALASVVIGIINCSIGPVLKFFTLPIRWLTIGVFTLVINGFLLLMASKVAPGFVIDDFGTAFWAAIVYSLVTWVGGLILAPAED
ncbi:MAG: phage holin family protein [Microthrixaceae bacterium]|nr:phage holin family protein [Microthrixaceae bacterium]